MGRRRKAVAGLIAIAIALGLQAAPSHWRAVRAANPAPGTITTIAGTSPNSGFATATAQQPYGLAVFGSTLYLSDQAGNVVRAVNLTTGLETVYAGSGASGTTGDGGPATGAALFGPRGLAVDSSGNLYIALQDRVRMVNTSGTISLVATGFSSAVGVASDAAGDVFVADTGNNEVKRIDHVTRAVSVVAGTGTAGFAGDGGPPASAQLNNPGGVVVDSTGSTLWIEDSYNERIRKVAGGVINTIAGAPTNVQDCTTGGGALSTGLLLPEGIAVDGSGNVFIADTNDMCVRELTGTTLTTVAGTGRIGYFGDGGPATSAKLAYPTGLTFDGSGDLLIADNYNQRVRKMTTGGIITTVVGTGFAPPTICSWNGDGDLATTILLCGPSGIAIDGSGDVFFSEPLLEVVREVTPAGVLKAVTGNGVPVDAGDGGPAISAEVNTPGALAFDAKGDLIIADSGYPGTIRMIDTSGVIHTIAGGGMSTPGPNPAPATSVYLERTNQITVAANGTDLYLADGFSNVVEKLTVATDTIQVVAGGGLNYPGDGGPAIMAKLYGAGGVAVDASGNLLLSSESRLQKVDPSGIITTVETFDQYHTPSNLEFAPNGELVGNNSYGQLVALTPAGSVTIAGSGNATFSGDGGPAYLAGLDATAFVFDAAGDIFAADTGNARVRRIQAFTSPTAPLGVSATPGIHSATVHWSAPADGGGLPIAQYTVRSYQGATPGPSIATGGTSVLIGGLAPGVPYTFTVTAFNGWSTGPASAASAPVTPTVLQSAGDILTYAGTIGTGPALSVGQVPYSLALVGTHLYIGDFGNPVIRDVNLTSGQEGVLAGNDSYGYTGDGGQASAATIEGAGAMAYCGGSLYFADTFNYVIRKIDATGRITTVAGIGQYGYGGDGGPAKSAEFGRIFGLACRTGGGLYVSDSDHGAVRIIDAAGNISTWWSGFSFPTGLTELGTPGVVAVSDSGLDNAVWSLTAQTATLLAGRPGYPGYSGDGAPAAGGFSQLNDPRGLAYLAGTLHIADRANNVIRDLNLQTGIINTAFVISGPAGLVPDAPNNQLYVAGFGSFTVMSFLAGSITSTQIAGNGTPSRSGDGGPATSAQLGNPYAVATDSAGDLFIADNQNEVIRKVDPTGTITTVAGIGTIGSGGDGGPAVAAQLNDPRGVAVAPNGDLYISDTSNHSVRKVDHTTGNISTFVSGLTNARGVAVDAAGNLYIANSDANLVYRVNSSGVVTVIAGTGAAGFSGDGGPATAATLRQPRALAIDSAFNVYISDSANNRIRRVDHATGIITTVAGNGTAGPAGDGHAAISAELNFPFGIALDGAGNLYVADELNNRIRIVDAQGNITSAVGICGGIAGFSGDGGLASIAEVNFPFGVAVDGFGDLFIADVDSNRVRAATSLAGFRNSSCPGPAGVAGSRGTKPSGGGPPPPRMSDGAGAPRALSDGPVPTGHGSNATVQPTRVVAQPAGTGAAPTRQAAAAARAEQAAARPGKGASRVQSRGHLAAATSSGPSQASSLPRGSASAALLLTTIALVSLVAPALRRRRWRERSARALKRRSG